MYLVSVNFKNKCDIFCVILIFLVKWLVCVNLKVFSKFVIVIWNIKVKFCNLVVGWVVF